MKKAIISILVILPLLLVVIIAITGRIYGNIEYIKVESIVFVDANGEEVDGEITLEVGQSKVFETIVNPLLASNPYLTFKSSNSNYCTVNSVSSNSGMGCVVKAIAVPQNGSVSVNITANSIDNVSETIVVNVIQKGSSSIEVDHKNLTGYKGLKSVLNATTIPSSEAQKLTWSSSDNNIVSVEGVGGKGVLTFNNVGNAIITIKTSDGLEEKCEVTVVENASPYFKSRANTVTTDTVNLLEYVENLGTSNISFEIISGSAILEENNLIFNGFGLVTIKMWTEDKNINYDEAKFLYM